MAESNQPKREGSIHIQFNKEVKIDELIEVVRGATALSGSTHCGILGLEIRLSGPPLKS